MKKRLQPFLLKLFSVLFLLAVQVGRSQTTPEWNPNLTPGGANSVLFKFTKQVWLNPSIILLKQRFEQETHVKLLLLPRLNNTDTSAKRMEKAFDMVLSLLVYKENTEGSIKFYFDPKNPGKPFSFGTSEELWCKFTRLQIDTVEQLLNKPLATNSNLENFAALPFDSIISQTSRYCKAILLAHPGSCGPDPENEFTLAKLNCVPARLNFEKVEQPQLLNNGGVDEQKYPSLAQYYNSVIDLSDKSNYPVAWKAIAAGKNDVIRIKITKKEKDFNFSKLVFKNSSGTETYNTGFDKTDSTIITLSIVGKPSGSMAEVVANYTNATGQNYVIGAFNIFFYEPKQLTLKVWDVDGANVDIAKIETELNKIYSNVFITWRVEKACSNIQLPVSIKKDIHVEKSGLLSNYMDDMQPINNYCKDNCSEYDSKAEDVCYMILGCKNDGGLAGYMPRARNIGFAFSNDPHTIAHELGHGAFGLKHIFCAEELGEGCQFQTNNLMDYSDGTTNIAQNNLYKHQWDLIHDPDFVGWFEGDDEEAELANRIWFTPDWKLFTLGGATRTIYPDFSGGTIPKGTIPGVSLDGTYYPAAFENGKFVGYKNGNNLLSITYYNSINDTAKCCLYYYNDCENSLFYTVKYKDVKNHTSGDLSMKGIPFIRKDKVACKHVTPKNNVVVINKSGVPYNSKDIETLLNGGKKFRSENDITYQSSFAKLYLTGVSTSDKDNLYIQEQCNLKDDTLRLWLHYTVDSVWIIKKGIDQYKFDKMLSSFGLTSSKTFNEIVSLSGKGVEQLAGILYTLGDWISKANNLKMPAEWWNCNNTAIYDPPFLIKVLTIALDPVAVVMKPIINQIDPDILSKVEKNGTLEQINFALYAGLWDGMIGLIGGVGDGVKMVTMNLATANEDAKKESAKMSKLISDNGGGIGGFGRLVWDGIKSGFDPDQPCVFAHTVGEFTFGIILGVLTGGEALASTAVGRALKTTVGVLDRLDVVSQAVSKVAGCALKLTYKAGRPVFKILYEGVKVLPEFFELPSSGKLYSFIIPLPKVNLKKGIKAFKESLDEGEIKIEPAVDKNGIAILTEDGEQLYTVKTKENEEVFLIKGEDAIISELEKYLRQQEKIQESMITLKGNNLLDRFPGVTEIQASSVHRYTVSSFELNRKLNMGLELSEFETKWLESIHEGLAQMRKNNNYVGYVYRGQTLDEALVLKKYVEPFNKAKATNAPALVEEKALLSCTKSDEVADFFVNLSKKKIKEGDVGVSVKFNIKSKRGVDIDDISDYGKFLCQKNPRCQAIQMEILLENGTFKINDIKVTNEGGVKHYDISLEEF